MFSKVFVVVYISFYINYYSKFIFKEVNKIQQLILGFFEGIWVQGQEEIDFIASIAS